MEYIRNSVKSLPRTKSGIVKDFPVNPDSNGVYTEFCKRYLANPLGLHIQVPPYICACLYRTLTSFDHTYLDYFVFYVRGDL